MSEYSPNWSPGDPLDEDDEVLSDEDARLLGVDAEDAHEWERGPDGQPVKR